jgi:hypothetical protein
MQVERNAGLRQQPSSASQCSPVPQLHIYGHLGHQQNIFGATGPGIAQYEVYPLRCTC